MKNDRLPNMACCPKCGARIDGFTGVNGQESPSDGSLSVCVYCSSLNVFVVSKSGDFSLRLITDSELSDIKKDRIAWRMVQTAMTLAKHFMLEKQSKEN